MKKITPKTATNKATVKPDYNQLKKELANLKDRLALCEDKLNNNTKAVSSIFNFLTKTEKTK